jgi:tryptophan synthase alpha chain
MTPARCLDMVRELRADGVQVPIILMGYYNPVLAYGPAAFCGDCAAAGVDGLIVPDLPPEEGQELEASCVFHGLALVYLLAPTSSVDRIRLVCRHSQGFVYVVSTAGTTGEREQLPVELDAFVGRVRAETSLPLAVGFGVSRPEQARRVAGLADGVIVGSALVRRVGEPDGLQQMGNLVADLVQAVHSR